MKFALVLVAMGFVSACNKSSNSSAAPATPGDSIPADIQMEIQSAQPLSAQDMAEIRGVMRNNDAKLPSNVLIYREDYSASSKDKDNRAEKMRALDSEGRGALRSTQINCIISDKVKSESAPVQKAGDSVTSIETQSITGDDCPLEHSLRSETKTTLVEYSIDQNTGSVTKASGYVTQSGVERTTMKDARWIQWSNGKTSSVMNSELQGAFDNTPGLSRMFAVLTIQGQVQTVAGINLKATFNVRTLMFGESSSFGSSKTKSDVVAKIYFPNFTLVLQQFNETAGDRTVVKKTLLNGRPSTPKELKDLLGSDFSLDVNPGSDSKK